MKRRQACAGSQGTTLVELLVATVIAGIALAAAWAWLWTVAAPARSLQAQAQSSSAAAYALRELTRDLQECSAMLLPTACSPERGLLLHHHHPGMAPETIPVVWDPARQVLWRRTSSTYLADHVSRFVVSFFSSSGDLVVAGTPGARLRDVARVRVEVTVTTAERAETAQADVAVRLP